MEPNNLETNEFLPSGDWEGFYCYHNSPIQHKMSIKLEFALNKVTGSGIDDIAPFKWIGDYDLTTFKIKKIKVYTTHEILYKGDIDENGIWGIWNSIEDLSQFKPEIVDILKKVFRDKMKGGFHIWPKKDNSLKISNEAKNSIILEKIYTEQLELA